MSIRLPPLDLSTFIVGQTGLYTDMRNAVTGYAPDIYIQRGNPHLYINNESPDGLTLTFRPSGTIVDVPAGGWGILEMVPDDTDIFWEILYQLNNAGVNLVLFRYYQPGEKMTEFTIGNSPISGAAAVSPTDRIVDPATMVGLFVLDLGGGNGIVLAPTAANRGMELDSVDIGGSSHPIFSTNPTGLVIGIGQIGLVGAAITMNNQTNFAADISLGGIINNYDSIVTGGQGIPFFLAQSPVDTGAVTVTTLQTPFSVTPANDQVWRFSAFVNVNNGVSGNNITAAVNYTNAFSGAAAVNPFTLVRNTGASVLATGANSVVNGTWTGLPVTVVVKGGSAVTVTYRDPTNTPSDRMLVIIEQLD